jgi:hypothetical protein
MPKKWKNRKVMHCQIFPQNTHEMHNPNMFVFRSARFPNATLDVVISFVLDTVL